MRSRSPARGGAPRAHGRRLATARSGPSQGGAPIHPSSRRLTRRDAGPLQARLDEIEAELAILRSRSPEDAAGALRAYRALYERVLAVLERLVEELPHDR